MKNTYIVMISNTRFIIRGEAIRIAEQNALLKFQTKYPDIDTSHLIITSFTLEEYIDIFGLDIFETSPVNVTCAIIEMEGMKAENSIRLFLNEIPTYDEMDFTKLIKKYKLNEHKIEMEVTKQ